MIDLSILIQGPASPKSDGFKILDKYKEYGNIIVSCYEEDETEFLTQFDFVKTVKNKTPILEDKIITIKKRINVTDVFLFEVKVFII